LQRRSQRKSFAWLGEPFAGFGWLEGATSLEASGYFLSTDCGWKSSLRSSLPLRDKPALS
jgi:hypothetical protein